jgi:GNAT superfamily N-acetyltransferase
LIGIVVMKVARVEHKRGRAPRGMIIERPSHGRLRYAINDSDAARKIQEIGQAAWANSDWLAQIAIDNEFTPDSLASRVFNPLNSSKVEEQFKRVKASAYAGQRATYWIGETLKPYPEDWNGDFLDIPGGVMPYLPQGKPHGFAKIEQQGGSGWRVIRAAQKLANVGIWVCLHDLDILPEYQGKGLGTALAYEGLRGQPQYLPSSLYAPLANEPIRFWAGKYGYRMCDEFEDTSVFGGLSVDFGHYVADSVGAVCERMVAVNPWLNDGTRESMSDLIQYEREVEVI